MENKIPSLVQGQSPRKATKTEKKLAAVNDLCRDVLHTAQMGFNVVALLVKDQLLFHGIGTLEDMKFIVMYFDPDMPKGDIHKIGRVVHDATQKEVLMLPRNVHLGQLDDDMMKQQGWVRDREAVVSPDISQSVEQTKGVH